MLFDEVKNPGPKDQALISSQRGDVCLQVANGMMEKWNSGSEMWMMFGLYF